MDVQALIAEWEKAGPSKACDFYEAELMRVGNKLVTALRDAQEREQQLREGVAEAVSIIENLADQQATPDDWYVPGLERLRRLAASSAAPEGENDA